MWFLEADIALRLLLGTALWAVLTLIAGKLGARKRLLPFLVVLDLVLIAYVSLPLAVFYGGYTLVTYGIAHLALPRRKRRRPGGEEDHSGRQSAVFVVCCLLCALPFFYLRLRDALPGLPLLFALTGLAYNMLKAVDGVYYVHYTGERMSFLTYANYMLFFPVITAGPILRYRDFARSMENPLPVTGESLTENVKRLIRGYFKKVVVLSLAGVVLERITAAGPHLALSVLACLLSYLLLWLDMSGYADIAIALGGCMGVAVPENFKNPLRAASFTQFWRNWHVSLTDWIREHIFVVLNGKRLSKYQGAAIGFGTMMVMGVWHGLTPAFLLEGVFNGVILALENLLGLTTVNKRKVKKSYYLLRCAIVTLIFSFTASFYALTADQFAVVLRGFVTL